MTAPTTLATNCDCTTVSTDRQIPKDGYGFLEYVLRSMESLPSARAMLGSVEASRCNTRPGYSPVSMWRLHCLKFLLNERFNVALIERLRSSARLREICGLAGAVPSEPTVSRFFAKLADGVPGLGELFVEQMVNRLQRRLPDDMGRVVAVDSTDIEAFANGNRPDRVDLGAEWGRRIRKNKTQAKDGDTEPFYGRKMHSLVDVVYGVPICHIVLSANENDSPVLPRLVEKAKSLYPWFNPKYLLGDRGYDSIENSRYLVKNGIEPIIHARKPTAHDGLYEGLYDKRGRPVCGDENVPTEYVRSEGNRHLFRCNPQGCSFRENSAGPMIFCNATTWIQSDPENVRAVGWKVARAGLSGRGSMPSDRR